MVSTRLKKAFDGNVCSFQESVCEAVRAAAKSTRSLFLCALGAINKSLRAVAGRAVRWGEFAEPETFSPRTTSQHAHADASTGWTRSTRVPPTASICNTFRAHNLFDHLRCGT